METRKQKLERWLKDAYDLFDDVRFSDDTDMIEHVRNRIDELEQEISDMPVDTVPMQRMDYEKELLTIMMEECGEVIQACSKIIRFGADETNLSNLEKELGDLFQMMELAHQYDLVSWTGIDSASMEKAEKLKKYSSLMG
jgi:NTP pyrophosphatase (non-canonical NTP hydrolase)